MYAFFQGFHSLRWVLLEGLDSWPCDGSLPVAKIIRCDLNLKEGLQLLKYCREAAIKNNVVAEVDLFSLRGTISLN